MAEQARRVRPSIDTLCGETLRSWPKGQASGSGSAAQRSAPIAATPAPEAPDMGMPQTQSGGEVPMPQAVPPPAKPATPPPTTSAAPRLAPPPMPPESALATSETTTHAPDVPAKAGTDAPSGSGYDPMPARPWIATPVLPHDRDDSYILAVRRKEEVLLRRAQPPSAPARNEPETSDRASGTTAVHSVDRSEALGRLPPELGFGRGSQILANFDHTRPFLGQDLTDLLSGSFRAFRT